MPTGKVKWYDTAKGFGFLTRDDGGDVFVPKGALPGGIDELKAGTRVEFGVAAGQRGEQALSLRVLDAPPTLAAPDRPTPEELHGMVEDMIKVLDAVQRELRRGRYPDKAKSRQVARIVHGVADALDG